MHPLAGRLDHHMALFVEIGDPRFRLEEGMLLPGGAKLAREYDIGLGQCMRGVPFANGHVQQHVRAVMFMDQRRVGCHPRTRIGDCGQVLILDMNQLGTCDGGLLALRRHQRHLITLETHDLATQDRLVSVDEPIGVVGHITCGQHGHHAGHLKGSAGINRLDARVRALGEDDLQMEHARPHQIGRIAGRARNLAQRVRARQRRSDQIGCHA